MFRRDEHVYCPRRSCDNNGSAPPCIRRRLLDNLFGGEAHDDDCKRGNANTNRISIGNDARVEEQTPFLSLAIMPTMSPFWHLNLRKQKAKKGTHAKRPPKLFPWVGGRWGALSIETTSFISWPPQQRSGRGGVFVGEMNVSSNYVCRSKWW